MDVKLVVEKGPARTKTVQLHREETLVGRRRDCDLCIPSSEVSRRHCILRFANGELSVEDLDSANGTYINDRRLTEKETVRPGDRLQIGPLTFRVRYQSAAFPADVEPVDSGVVETKMVEAGPNPFAFGQAAGADGVVLADDEPLEAVILPEDDDDEPVVLEEAEPDVEPGKKPHTVASDAAPAPTMLTDEPVGDFNADFEIVMDEDILVDEEDALELPQGDKFRDLLNGLDK
jgi:pSer/pThr/pTyr-binding forkhead associated (FHA) protein